MTNEEINKRIYELLGLCQHKRNLSNLRCVHCNRWYAEDDILFFCKDWKAFGVLWEWWQKHEKFEVFFSKVLFDGMSTGKRTISQIVAELLVPRGLAEATVEFFKGTE